jgi:hypothetical protein
VLLEMANTLMQAVDDRLTGRDNLVLVVVEVEDPAREGLRVADIHGEDDQVDHRVEDQDAAEHQD